MNFQIDEQAVQDAMNSAASKAISEDRALRAEVRKELFGNKEP